MDITGLVFAAFILLVFICDKAGFIQHEWEETGDNINTLNASGTME